ncbi:MAG: hypothetical protein HC827_05985 [Cyanobacteria bacterium RM1_2_2]|nr:hypothetical protein [Cyanobacteria bacterium RM1_2_2]
MQFVEANSRLALRGSGRSKVPSDEFKVHCRRYTSPSGSELGFAGC